MVSSLDNLPALQRPARQRSMEFWISVLLTLLGYLPGILYTVYVIVSVDPDHARRRRGVDPDDYIYVA
ncbi:hypothetical protein E2562_008428 [Oryza meyeriana var. granulata]|uniref:Uncharacterized protein n=1 Tax=Oryza meyeriana var. granulata TaxID=110450 RepID=A0A6G1CP66_9ORYZ|nr:hypothetical protein E2562_011786 [Oryza meyeriana var. granulata]KAF0924111.1 hypothetical protein E2562_008428 [Oryza meyeriana var. granulata]